jgi:AraC-like DNA-binding protein
MPAYMSAPVRTVSNRIAVRALQGAEQAGISPQVFFEGTGITAGELADPGGRIDAERHRRMLALGSERNADYPWESINADVLFIDFPVLGNLCVNAANLREALASFATYRPLIGGFDLLSARHADGIVRLEYLAEFTPGDSLQALGHFQALACLIRIYDHGTPTRFDIELMGPELACARGISAFFGARVRYGCAANRMHFAASALDLPFAHYNASLAPMLRRQAQHELERIQRLHEFSARVESLIRRQVADPDTGSEEARLIQHICARLDMSRWALYRRLQDEGTSFREIELKVRLTESRRLLTDTHKSVAEISDHMGFASQSAFTRFFRSQYGVAPLAFRRNGESGRDGKLLC